MKDVIRRCCRNQATQLALLIILTPVALIPVALPIAGALAGYENWTFDQALEFTMCGLLRMALPTGPARDINITAGNVTTIEYKLLQIETADGAICEVFIGIVSLTAFGFILNKINSFKFGERLAETGAGLCSKKIKGHDNKLMVQVTIMTFLIYPVTVLIFAMMFGDIVAAFEGKTFGSGILWSFGNILNTNRLLPGREMALRNINAKFWALELQMLQLFLQAILLDYIVNLVWYKHQLGTAYETNNENAEDREVEKDKHNQTISTTYDHSNTEMILKAPTPVKSGAKYLPPINA
eukprot:g3022.t1